MKFKEIELVDYRQYFGKQKLNIASGKETNVTLVDGANGAGKTNFFEAINWCLYGECDRSRGAIVSKEKAFPAKIGDLIGCSVSIWFEHEGEEYVAIRKACAKKFKYEPPVIETEDEKIERYKGFTLKMIPSTEQDFKVLRRTDKGMKEESDPTIMIDRALPQNARQYFLFDGEKIENLSKPEHDHEIKEAVKNVLQLPSILRAMEHVDILRKEYLRGAKKTSANVSEREMLNAKEQLDSEMEKQKSSHKANIEKIVQIRELKSKIDQDLKKFGAIRELTKRREDLQRNYDSCRKRVADIKNKIADSLSKSHLVMCKKLLEDSGKLIEEKRKRMHIPPGIRESFIADLIENRECICGNDLSEGGNGRTKIQKYLLESRTNTQIAEELSEIIADLNQIKTSRDDIKKYLKTDNAEWLNLIEEIDDLSGRIEDVHSQITKVGETDITKLESARAKCEEDEYGILKKQAEIEVKVKEMQEISKEVERNIAWLSKAKTATGKLTRITKLAEMSYEILQKVYEEFAQEKRKEIEKELKKIFNLLIWKKDQFPDVRLTENYSLQLFDKWHSPAREELSAGERQVLSLSFITAMAFVAGGKIPLIMDTPFGRLFSEHRANIAREIPNLTNQWVLLVQDEEISQSTWNVLAPRVGRHYKLEFQDGCTQIKEVKIEN